MFFLAVIAQLDIPTYRYCPIQNCHSKKKKKKIRSFPIIAWVIESIVVYQFYFSYFEQLTKQRQNFSISHALKRWYTSANKWRRNSAFFLGASISHSRTHLYRWKLSPQVFVINFSMGYISNKILWMRCYKFSFLCDWLDTNPAGPELRTHCPILFFFLG